ncbi:FAD-dependent monooxygenase [Nocardia sp. NPDC004068]|uniref:FAD-dependent monooxygenase n=1 Tax=Nocardia sp. NPDC004068 TaxID=3364303 RepID=UPI0036955023
MRNERVLISGAGIAGQALGYLLARNGFRPTIVERAGTLRRGGQGVDIRDEALEVGERMGILARVRAAGADVLGMRFVDAAGARVSEVRLRRPGDEPAADVEIMRGDLIELLHEIGSGAVEYRFGDSIETLEQDRDGVTVTFEHAAAERFDLVIGADGLHSRVRRLAFGPERDHARHMGHYFAFGDADASLGPDRWVTMYNAPGAMAGLYRSGNHPQAKAYFMFRSPRLDLDPRDPATAHLLLTRHFGHRTAWQIPRLLDGVLADPDLYFDSLTQIRMSAWSTGRVALVGDAAYSPSPASGAGAELALVGADRLAAALTAADGDHQRAFPRYTATHLPLTRTKQRLGPNLRLMIPKTHGGIVFRNVLTRLPMPRPLGA